MTRAMDITFSFIGLILVLPLFMIIIPILRLTGEGEIFYRQPRIGKKGNAFLLLKFATMLKDSPKLSTGDITVKNDFRVLKTGRFLRKTKINELPQIWNILKGDMSLVGPRPMTEKNFSYYAADVKEKIASVRPGLTGIGSIVFRDEENILNGMEDKIAYYRNSIAPYKGELECWYIEHMSLKTYFALILFTALAIVRPHSRYYRSFFKNLPTIPADLQVNLDK